MRKVMTAVAVLVMVLGFAGVANAQSVRGTVSLSITLDLGPGLLRPVTSAGVARAATATTTKFARFLRRTRDRLEGIVGADAARATVQRLERDALVIDDGRPLAAGGVRPPAFVRESERRALYSL